MSEQAVKHCLGEFDLMSTLHGVFGGFLNGDLVCSR